MIGDGATADEESAPAAVRLAHEIRRLRKAANLSHPQLAELVGYTRQYISMAERTGKNLPSRDLVSALDKILHADGALLALREQAKSDQLALRRSSTDKPPIADPIQPVTAGDLRVPGGVENTNRRQLIALAAAVTFGGALDQPAAQIIAESDQAKIPTAVRIGDVRELQNTIGILEAWDHHAGGGAVRHHILGALRWGVGLLESSCTPSVRTKLAATVAQLADLAAWATFDAGFHAQARKLFLLGLQAAYESGDLGIRAHVATGLARQEIHMGNPQAALELVQLAQTAADALTPNAVSMLHTVKALAYAKTPDTDLCQRFAQTAIDCYKVESINNDPPWIRFFTPAKLNGDTANALFDLLITNSPLLGQAEAPKSSSRIRADLVSRLSSAVERYPDARARSKAIAAARLATFLYLEGEPDRANQAAMTALSLGGGVRSARLSGDLRVLARATCAAPRSDTARRVRADADALAINMM